MYYFTTCRLLYCTKPANCGMRNAVEKWRRGTSALAAQTMCRRGERGGASPGGTMWHRVRRARGQLGRRGACALAAPMARQRGAMTRHVRAAARGTPDPHAATGRGWGKPTLVCATQHAAGCGMQCTRRGKGHPRRRADGASARGGGSARRDWPWAGHGGQESTCACARREALLVAKRTRDRSRRGLSQREHFTRYK